VSCAVFANSREIACKVSDGKSICATPDVCFTPPQTPATPPGVPIPYPNTGMASDTDQGSTTVQIGGDQIMMKNSSCFKKSTGDEAGSAPKKGIVTSQTTGKVYFTAWSMDVMVEGANVPRHLDITSHNHASEPGNSMITAFIASQATGKEKSCSDEAKDCEKCSKSPSNPKGGMNCSDKCKQAVACCLISKKDDKKKCCHPDTTGHHLVEVHCFTATGGRAGGKRLDGFGDYRDRDAPCVCASRARNEGSHGVMHAVQGQMEGNFNAQEGAPLATWANAGPLLKPGGTARGPAESKWDYSDARETGVMAHKMAFPHCNSECIRKQLDAYHKDELGLEDDTPVRSDPGVEDRSSGDLDEDQQEQMDDITNQMQDIDTEMGGM
jgi:Domain of unknown function (DUF4150)/GHH signature containing HNH/Endo VII superfamily nuclease toxin  2